MERLQERFRVKKPQGFGLTKPLLRDWAVYRDRSDHLDKEIFAPLAMRVDQVLGEVVDEFNVPLDQRRRVEDAIQDTANRSVKELASMGRTAIDEGRKVQEAVATKVRAAAAAL